MSEVSGQNGGVVLGVVSAPAGLRTRTAFSTPSLVSQLVTGGALGLEQELGASQEQPQLRLALQGFQRQPVGKMGEDVGRGFVPDWDISSSEGSKAQEDVQPRGWIDLGLDHPRVSPGHGSRLCDDPALCPPSSPHKTKCSPCHCSSSSSDSSGQQQGTPAKGESSQGGNEPDSSHSGGKSWYRRSREPSWRNQKIKNTTP